MNKFDERYEFRFAKLDEDDRMMRWLNDNWQNDHILSKNKKLFTYEFCDKDKINLFLAIDKNTKTIEGVLGIIYSSSNLKKNGVDIFFTIWKVRDGNELFLGVEIYNRLLSSIDFRYCIGNGHRKVAVRILSYVTNDIITKMKHYYLPNPSFQKDDFIIADIKKENIKSKSLNSALINKNSSFDVIKFLSFEEFECTVSDSIFDNCIPIKDKWFINKRFFNHPIYNYDVYGIKVESKITAVFVVRKQEYLDHYVLRIINYIGNQYSFLCAKTFLYSLFDEKLEYIDFYEYGFDDNVLLEMNFIDNSNGDNIIPNYFYPFVKENKEIWIQIPTSNNALICKGDGDQDRPN